MFTGDLGLYLFRLYLSRVLTAISGIGIAVLLVFWLLDLGDLYEAMQDTLLILLPITAYQCGWVEGYFRARG